MSQPILAIDSLVTGYRSSKGQQTKVSDGLDLAVREGEFTVLLGPNGAGKSTLLRTVCGLQEPLGGRVLLGGRDLHELAPRDRARLLGVVLTERVQTWGLTVWDLVALGRAPHTRWSGRLGAKDRAVVTKVLKSTDTAHFAARRVSELSDGERQRVLVARALAQSPLGLVLDEVTAFLDLARRTEIMLLLRRLAHEEGKAMLLSTHDLDLALRTADRLWMIDRTGRVHEGCPEDLVLAGTLARVFHHEGLDYDVEAGRFRMEWPRGVPVELIATGAEAKWTRHALERCGFEVAPEGSGRASVHVRVGAEGPRWRLKNGNDQSSHTSLDELTRALDFMFLDSSTQSTSAGSEDIA